MLRSFLLLFNQLCETLHFLTVAGVTLLDGLIALHVANVFKMKGLRLISSGITLYCFIALQLENNQIVDTNMSYIAQ